MPQVFQQHDERTPLLGESTVSGAGIPVDVQEAASRIVVLETEENEAINQYSLLRSPTKVTEETTIKDAPASWLTLPNKRQLALLALCRFVEPVSQTSVLSYLYYFLHSLDPSLPSAALSRRAGYLASAFATCMFLTGWFWGRVADKIGRKKVVLLGLTATSIASVVFGFSESYGGLVVARCLAGLMDGNIAILRTMITETVVDKKYHSRAFLILPLTFNLGAVLGPMLGGFLADPTSSQSPASKIFGPGTFFGGENGVEWMRRWKYALPNVVSAILLVTIAGLCFLFLEETLETRKNDPDPGIYIRKRLERFLLPSKYIGGTTAPQRDHTGAEAFSRPPSSRYSENAVDENDSNLEVIPERITIIHAPAKIWTRNVKLTILSCAILPLHMSTFMHLWGVFLSTPRLSNQHQHLPFHFNGGLGLPPASIGLAFSIFGILGISTQILAYPTVVQHMGILSLYRWSLFVFPLAYFLLPYLSILPSTVPPPAAAAGPAVWVGIALVLILQVAARTFALPSSVILLTNSAPSSLVLGRVHGLAVSLASLSKAVGPAVAGVLFGLGLKVGVVGTAWWALAGASVVGAVVGLWLREDGGVRDAEQDGK